MNQKGQLGLDVVKGVLVLVLTIAVIAVTIIVIMPEVRDAAENLQTQNGVGVNETLTTVTETGETLSANTLRNIVCTFGLVTNATGGETIPANNYTTSGCTISAVGTHYNNTNWNVSYTYTYDDPFAAEITGNLSVGTTDFFDNAPTIFTILGVVAVIAAVTLIIVFVRRGIQSGGSVL